MARVTVSGDNGVVALRVFPKDRGGATEVARALSDLATREGWRFEELRIEEGRLDDVFRSITRPESARPGE